MEILLIFHKLYIQIIMHIWTLLKEFSVKTHSLLRKFKTFNLRKFWIPKKHYQQCQEERKIPKGWRPENQDIHCNVHPKNGTLIKALKEAEIEISKITRFRVRYQEAGGIQLARLFSTDLGKRQPFEREECQPCGRYGRNDEKSPNCKQAKIVHESSC